MMIISILWVNIYIYIPLCVLYMISPHISMSNGHKSLLDPVGVLETSTLSFHGNTEIKNFNKS